MRRRSAIVGIVACPLTACVAQPPVQDALHPRVEALVAPLVDARQFSGAVVLMRDGRVLLSHAWGLASREPERAFTPDTPSDGASLAKTFTAAGLWALVHEGRLAMDQPVQALVPEYPHAGTTVGQLDDGLVYDAYAVSPEVFYVPGTDWWLAFSEREPGHATGRPAGLRLHLRGMYHDVQAWRLE